jgi:hypothetical protein
MQARIVRLHNLLLEFIKMFKNILYARANFVLGGLSVIAVVDSGN